MVLGLDPILIYGRLITETLGNWYGIGQVLFKSTTFIFTGLAAAIAFRTGLFNIGAEGQMTVGAFVIAYVGFTFAGLPAIMLIACCLTAGFLAGAIWGAVPGILKSRYGAHEVITTIMMNFIAAALVSYLINYHFGVPATVHTLVIAPGASLARLESVFSALRGSPVNVSFIISLISALCLYYVIIRTRLGFELRTTGLSKSAAEYAHINITSRTFIAMMISGGIAGLGGSNFVMGYKHYFEIGFSDGAGFIGIAVALLGKNHPVGIIIAAMFFGMLEYGGLTINTLVPKELVNILQAIIILSMIILTKIFDAQVFRLTQKRFAEQQYA